MAYLLGLIYGNGEVKRFQNETMFSIEIPHKKQLTDKGQDILIYVRASFTDIRSALEPLIGSDLQFNQEKNVSTLFFKKPNSDYLIRELMRFTGRAVSHENIEFSKEIFQFTHDECISFLRGFADVTGYIRRSNHYFQEYSHRVYLEIPRNWQMVIEVCNLLRTVDVPVQTIDWAHPNIRDGNLKKFNQGNVNFWKKEHQVKIFANEFEKINFTVMHKKEALISLSNELINGYKRSGINASDFTHRYYWEINKRKRKTRPYHPGEDDQFIPERIRGKHYDYWWEIAYDLGYKEK